MMFGNLIRECGVLKSLSDSAQNQLANLITLVLGISVAFKMRAEPVRNHGYAGYNRSWAGCVYL